MFSSIINHNKQLDALYLQLKNCLHSAQNPEDLYHVVEQVKSFNKPLEYNNSLVVIILIVLIAIAICMIKFLSASNIFLLGLIIDIVLIMILGYFFVKRCRASNTLSQDIFIKKLLFDNQLTPLEFDKSSLTQDLQHRFKDFIRGNHTREIQLLYAGQYQGQEHQFQYHYYKFHYVVKRTVTRTDSNGKTRTETEYTDYYRYGVFLNFPYVANLSLDKPTLLFNGGVYRPASNQFNRYYTVNGSSQMVAAKFLKPMIVQAFEDIYSQFSEIRFEFNGNNELCMSFNNSDTFDYSRQSGLDEPDKFLAELKQPKILTRLNIILSHIERLMTYSDNNFSIDK